MLEISEKQYQDFLSAMSSQQEIICGSEIHQIMHIMAQRALKITAEINTQYLSPEDLHTKMELLMQQKIGAGFGLFPPFYSNCGINTRIGKNVFINSGCHFQDQGGIVIEDEVLIGHNVVIATLNHPLNPKQRGNIQPKSVHIGARVWIGANATICPGVSIGTGVIIAAGAVVTQNIPPQVVAGGVPAKVIKEIPEGTKNES